MASTGLRSFYQKLTKDMSPPVFFGAGLVVISFCVYGILATENASRTFEALQIRVTTYAGWYYLLIVTGLLGFCLWLAFSDVRKIRIGGPDAKPEFGLLSWFAMLFTAGMGIGLVYWAVAEPVLHYASPLMADPMTDMARREAMRMTFFHWGLHPWAIYAVLALAVAVSHFNLGLPLTPRSVFFPILGQRIHGPIGDGIDILSTVGTLLGVSTSLGLGAQQIAAGLEQFAGFGDSLRLQLTIIAVITGVAVVSVVLGVKEGIQRLARLNGLLAIVVVGFVFVAGPTFTILQTFVTTLGGYVQNLPRMSLFIDVGDTSWQKDWTFFYWGWWISWAPFVAIFVARISRGRTVGEFVATVLLVPTLVTFVWVSVFGGAALEHEVGGTGSLSGVAAERPAVALYAFLADLPFPTITQVTATLLITIFFITSSDSGSLVDDIVTAGGRLHPPRWQRVFWATAEGAAAMTLLIVGGLQAIRNASISLGVLMSLIVIGAAVSLAIRLPRMKQDLIREG